MTNSNANIYELSSDEAELVSGGFAPLLILLAKAAVAGAGIGATAVGIKLAVEDLSGQPGHNHYGK